MSYTKTLAERKLHRVVACAGWLALKTAADAFDHRLPPHTAGYAYLRNREATRVVSHSQPGAGAWLDDHPDHSIAASRPPSAVFITACQRKAGLFLTSLAPALDAFAARGGAVSDADRLGDIVQARREGDSSSPMTRATCSCTCDLVRGSEQFASSG